MLCRYRHTIRPSHNGTRRRRRAPWWSVDFSLCCLCRTSYNLKSDDFVNPFFDEALTMFAGPFEVQVEEVGAFDVDELRHFRVRVGRQEADAVLRPHALRFRRHEPVHKLLRQVLVRTVFDEGHRFDGRDGAFGREANRHVVTALGGLDAVDEEKYAAGRLTGG